jgi:16S rRNA (uracil1498-N3)-methyltransferase
MNMILFEEKHESLVLSAEDPRARHILTVLGMKTGDSFDVGVENGPRGKAIIQCVRNNTVSVSFRWLEEPSPSLPVTYLIGLPRPQTARKILTEGTSLGCSRIFFFRSDKGESSYAQSRLWTTREWHRLILKGAEQAFTTRLPKIKHFENLGECFTDGNLPSLRLALDNYEAECGLSVVPLCDQPLVIAFGSERGWSDQERKLLRSNGFKLVHLGERVLRVETACSVALGIVAARLNWI